MPCIRLGSCINSDYKVQNVSDILIDEKTIKLNDLKTFEDKLFNLGYMKVFDIILKV